MRLETLTNDLHAAMKAGETRKRDVLRFAITAVKNEGTTGKTALDDVDVEAVVTRVVKQLTQAAEEFRGAGDDARADEELAQADILRAYLPTPLTTEELSKIVTTTIEQLGAGSMADMGRVMQAVKVKAGNRADGGAVAELVRAHLAA